SHSLSYFQRSLKQTWRTPATKKPDFRRASFEVAVREGFEPSVPFPVRQFSKLFLSATQAPHRFAPANVTQKNEFKKTWMPKKQIHERLFYRTHGVRIAFRKRRAFFARIVVDTDVVDALQHLLEYFT